MNDINRRVQLEALRVANESDADDESSSNSSGIQYESADDSDDGGASNEDEEREGEEMVEEQEQQIGDGGQIFEGDNEDDHSELEGNEGGNAGNVFEVMNPDGDAEQNALGENYLLINMKKWGMRGVSFKKIDEMLNILRPLHPYLPRSHKTLLGTPRNTALRDLGTGLFWYKGVLPNLQQRVTRQYLDNHNNKICLDVNIDGLEPYPSADTCIWPILGKLVNQKEPFVIAAYCGKEKLGQNELEDFLGEYVDEVSEYTQNGVRLFDRQCSLSIRNYILDAPARAFVKCIIAHNGTFGCEKCEVEGLWVMNRTVFLDTNAPLRSDLSFIHQTNPLHHKGVSPLERIPTNMVSSFRLDAMHLLYAGVMKRWLKFVLGVRKKRRGKLREAEVLALNNIIDGFKMHVPSDFNRRPRNFDSYARFKCTEFRRILMYDGLVIFRHCGPSIWKSYVLLQCAIFILNSPSLVRTLNEVAKLILFQFVAHAQRYFGPHFLVYNIHSLIHLADECSEHGTADSFSAFPFESYLGVIKKLLRSFNKPLHQMYKRDHERKGRLIKPAAEEDADVITLKNKRTDFEDEVEGVYYTGIELSQTNLAVNAADCCFESSDGDILVLENIVHTPDGRVLFITHKFLLLEDYYTFPLKSSCIGIFKVGNLDASRKIIDSSKFLLKRTLYPIGDESFVSIPLLHTT